MNKILLPLMALFLVLAGCKSDDRPDPEPVTYGYDYYPIKTGDYKIYEVTEIKQLGDTSLTEYTSDTTRFQLRETVDSAFTDAANEEFFRIIRHRRNTGAGVWEEDSVMVVKKTEARLERVENNLREVKLVFPMSVGRSWNVNMLNANAERTVVYKQIDRPYTLQRSNGQVQFDQTALVAAQLDSSGLQVQRYSERYARNTGLIETLVENIYYDDLQIGSGIIEQANYKTVRLLESGHNE